MTLPVDFMKVVKIGDMDVVNAVAVVGAVDDMDAEFDAMKGE